MITDRKSFILGLVMAVTFLAVFFFLFTPSFGGKNAFDASDNLFNSISKGSTYYIAGLQQKAEAYRQTSLDARLELEGAEEDAATLLAFHRIDARPQNGGLAVKADLGDLLSSALADSDAMFNNRGDEIAGKYGIPEKRALFAWWNLLQATEKALNNQSKFGQASFVNEVTTKGVEVAYNFYGVEPEKATSKAGILSFSLVFYVIYTLWWGYAVYYLAQGLGFQLKAGAKKEV